MEDISHLVIEVSGLKDGEEFYRDILGFESIGRDCVPDCGRSVSLQAASGQWLILAENPQPRSLPETGVHQAYTVGTADRELFEKKLAGRGVEIHTYKEDRPAEEKYNFYFYDPSGNRIQLINSGKVSGAGGKVIGIDHAVVECHDLEWAEDFYVKILRLTVDHRVGWRTDDYLRAKLWGEGKENMAPGTRRWDKRYTVMEQKRLIPRPNTQLFTRVGSGVLGIYLATSHRQEPPEAQIVGTPRVGFRADRRTLEETAKLLGEKRVAAHGPVEHAASVPMAASLYVRDPGGNFLEICVPR